jgi:transposase
VDSSSIEVNRRKRRTKTDRMDVEKLLKLIVRQQLGEQGSFSVVHVPGWEAEDRRQLHRELETLKKERTSHISRIKALLATQGLRISLRKDFPRHLSELTLWDGRHVPPYLQSRLLREYERILQVQEQRAAVRVVRRELLRHSMDADVGMVRHLMALKSIGVETAWTMVMEFFGWRDFNNQRELGGLSGLCGTPYDSGGSQRDLGVSKAGNRRVRTLCVELAWRWLIFQPDSDLTRWFNARYADGGSRVRRVGIVALARKLLVALWRYLEKGEIPEGAVLKTAEF